MTRRLLMVLLLAAPLTACPGPPPDPPAVGFSAPKGHKQRQPPAPSTPTTSADAKASSDTRASRDADTRDQR